MFSTNDAFSIPNHSPTFPNHSLFPDTEAPNSAEYSYPPAQTSSPYPPSPYPRSQRHDDMDTPGEDMRPDARTGDSILSMHGTRSGYPSLAQSWSRVQAWLARHYPELGDTLNYGILPEDLHEIQRQFGFPLPPPIRDSYLQVDGQEAESSAGCSEGLFFGLSLLSLEEMYEEWRFWREVDQDPATGANPKLQQRMKSIPSGWIRTEYSNRGWLPLATDRVGNYLGIDLNPGEKGSPGQVIIFGRDFDTKVVMWRGDGEGGWAKWLAAFAEELETGDTFEVGNQDTNSEGSEDSIGHEPYFFDGSANGARGEGGGDGGAVGIRLNGEYKGWNVLEALADRSVKRWKDSGVVTEEEYPQVNTKRISGLVGLPTLPQDTGVEVPIPLIDDAPTSSASGRDTLQPIDPETPRVRSHPKGKASASINRPIPQPIALPTPSDIAVDVASSLSDSEMIAPGDDGDLERGNRLPLRSMESNPPSRHGMRPDGTATSPRISGEDTRLLKRISVEPPTPVVTDSTGDLVTLPHKRRSPSPEDLLNDDPPTALPMAAMSTASESSPKTNGLSDLPESKSTAKAATSPPSGKRAKIAEAAT
ncbi:hypothetical protein CPB86DRAFT_774209 [Serendipita vermifera]|nr:hypothetical protein CPB86DRAFT_774209 [Serendipita vermifera]